MSTTCILRVPLTGGGEGTNEHSFVLIRVTGETSPSISLDLLGTDEVYPYHATVRQSTVQSYMSKGALKDKEWMAVLAWVFMAQKPSGQLDELVRQVEMVANVKEGKEIVLVLRQRVSDIVKRLGSMTLTCDNSQDVELFTWAAIAADSVAKANSTHRDLQLQFDAQQETINKLNAQLDDLTRAKQEEEEALLNKFCQLLNTKKAKIRDQMRLLSTAIVDSTVANQVRKTRKSANSESSTAKSRKRKASGTPDLDGSPHQDEPKMADEDTKFGGSDSEDAFERAQTPERNDEDATDDDDDSTLPHTKSIQEPTVTRSLRSRGRNEMDEVQEEIEQPPRRELPFEKNTAVQPEESQAKDATIDDKDSDETDDEL